MGKESWMWSAGSGAPWAGVACGQRARFFEFGEVRLAVLSLLEEAPKHGYQLMKEMENRSGGVYRASAGSVYPALQQMEKERLVAGALESGRRVFRLTAAGKSQLRKDPEAVRRIWERAQRWEDWGQYMGPETVAFAGPVARVMKSALRSAKWAAGRPEREERLRATIDKMCKELDQMAR